MISLLFKKVAGYCVHLEVLCPVCSLVIFTISTVLSCNDFPLMLVAVPLRTHFDVLVLPLFQVRA